MAINSLETSDLITHTDVIKRFIERGIDAQRIDYTSDKEARNASAVMRDYVNKHYYDNICIIQRGPDVLIYRSTRKRKRGAYKC